MTSANAPSRSPPRDIHYVAAFVALAVVLVAFSAWLARRIHDQAREQGMAQLTAVAQLKAREVERWIKDKTIYLAEPPGGFLPTAFARWLAHGGRPDADRNALVERLTQMRQMSPEHRGIWLFDAAGQLRLAGAGQPQATQSHYAGTARQALANGKPAVVDFHSEPDAAGRQETSLEVIVPLLQGGHEAPHPVGYLLVEFDPAEHLFPLIQGWPTASATAETLLLRVDGDAVVTLNDLRLTVGAALAIRRPLAESGRLDVAAVRAGRGPVTGVDYRDRVALGVVEPIAAHGWYLLTKIDGDELYGQARGDTAAIAAAGALLLTGFGATGWFSRRHGRERRRAAVLEAEIARQRMEKRFDFFVRYAQDIVLLSDQQGNLLDANEAATRAYGRGRDELLRCNVRDLRHPSTLIDLPRQWAAADRDGSAFFETLHVRADGTPFPVELSIQSIEHEGTRYRQSIIRDISERKRIDEELRSQHQVLQATIDAAQESIVMVRRDGTILAINDVGAARFHTRPHHLIGRNLFDMLPDELRAARRTVVEQALADQLPVRLCDERGGRTYDYSVNPLGDDDDRVVVFAADITEQRAAEDAARRAERRLSMALEAANETIWEWNVVTGEIYVSPNFYDILGFEQGAFPLNHAAWGGLLHPDDRPRVLDAQQARLVAGAELFENEYRMRHRDGHWLRVQSRGKVIRHSGDGRPEVIAGTARDITERKDQEQALMDNLDHQRQLNRKLEEAQNQLLQSEKMASIGQLAAGVAHELNNPIGFVHSNLGTLEGYLRDLFAIVEAYGQWESRLPPTPDLDAVRALKREKEYDFLKQDVADLMVESRDGLGRVRKIVQDLKDFSRVGETDWRWASLHQGLDSTLNIVWNELKYKCKVVKEYGELPEVFCLPSQLNQVFMNLLVNAGQAIEDQGTITIRSGGDGDGEQVWVAVSDTGKGIPPENINRIFEPFFTTKPVGKGTGLGLSLSYSIVKKHKGRIEVQSTPGAGSTFTVHLPVKPEIEVASKEMAAMGQTS